MPHFRYRLQCLSHSICIFAFKETFLLQPEILLGIFTPCKYISTCTKKPPLKIANQLHTISKVEVNRVSHTLWLWCPSVNHAVVSAFCWSSGDGFWLFPHRPPAETHNYSKNFKDVPCLQDSFSPSTLLTHSFGNSLGFIFFKEKNSIFLSAKSRWHKTEELIA